VRLKKTFYILVTILPFRKKERPVEHGELDKMWMALGSFSKYHVEYLKANPPLPVPPPPQPTPSHDDGSEEDGDDLDMADEKPGLKNLNVSSKVRGRVTRPFASLSKLLTSWGLSNSKASSLPPVATKSIILVSNTGQLNLMGTAS
jgi:hypothetical protein